MPRLERDLEVGEAVCVEADAPESWAHPLPVRSGGVSLAVGSQLERRIRHGGDNGAMVTTGGDEGSGGQGEGSSHGADTYAGRKRPPS
jgi:hypothetical protein